MPKSLGEAVRAMRKKAGLSQYALASAARVDQAILSRLETGVRNTVRLDVLCRISDALGVSVDDLLTEAGLKKPRGQRRNVKVAAQGAALEQQIFSVERALRRTLDELEKIRSRSRAE